MYAASLPLALLLLMENMEGRSRDKARFHSPEGFTAMAVHCCHVGGEENETLTKALCLTWREELPRASCICHQDGSNESEEKEGVATQIHGCKKRRDESDCCLLEVGTENLKTLRTFRVKHFIFM